MLLELHKELGNLRKQNKTDFEKPIEFEIFEKGVLRYTRGSLCVTANNSCSETELSDSEIVFGFGANGRKLAPGGAVIQRR